MAGKDSDKQAEIERAHQEVRATLERTRELIQRVEQLIEDCREDLPAVPANPER